MFIIDLQVVPPSRQAPHDAIHLLEIRNVRTLERVAIQLDGHNRDLVEVVVFFNGGERVALESRIGRKAANTRVAAFLEEYRKGTQFFYTSQEAKKLYEGSQITKTVTA